MLSVRTPKNRPNILALTIWFYDEGLVQSAALPHLRIIHRQRPEATIYIATEEKNDDWKAPQKRAAVAASLRPHGIEWVPQPYKPMGWRKYISQTKSLLKMVRFIRRNKIGTIHAFCSTAGTLGYLLSRITACRLVVDSFEPHSAYMLEGAVWAKGSLAYRALAYFERRQARDADAILATTRSMVDYSRAEYGADVSEYFVKPACVNLELFRYRADQGAWLRAEMGAAPDSVVGVYAGKFGSNYLEKDAFDIFAAAHRRWGPCFKLLLLTPHTPEEVYPLSASSGLPKNCITVRNVPHEEVPHWLSAADFAFSLFTPSPSKAFLTPIKDGEYWAIGLPVLIPYGISDDSGIIARHSIGAVLPDLTVASYEAAMRTIDGLLTGEPRDALRARIRAVAERYRAFSIAEDAYAQIYGGGKEAAGKARNAPQPAAL